MDVSDLDGPVVFSLSKTDKKFSENDIVWVKWKNWPQLPALIKHVYSAKKRVTCKMFLTHEDFGVGFNNVMLYCDAKKEEIMKSVEMMSEEHQSLFKHSVDAAEQYIAQQHGSAERSPRKPAAAETIAVSRSGKKRLSCSSGEAILNTKRRCASELPKQNERKSTSKWKALSKTKSKSCSELNLNVKQNNVACVDLKDTCTVVDNNVNGFNVDAMYIETSDVKDMITHIRKCKKSRKQRRKTSDKVVVELEDNTKAKAMPENHLNITADQYVLNCSLPTPHPLRRSSSSSVSYDPNVDASHSESDSDEDLPLGLAPLKLGKPAAAETIAVSRSGKKRLSCSSGEAILNTKRRCASELPKQNERKSTSKWKALSKTKSKSCSELNLKVKQNNVACVDLKDTCTVVDNNVNGFNVDAMYIETSDVKDMITHIRNCKNSRKQRRKTSDKVVVELEDNTKAKAMPENHLNITVDQSVLKCSLPTPHPPRRSSSSSVSYDPNVDASSHSESDSDEDLPLGLTPLKLEKKFSKNDIVWVKWRKWPQLPAVVERVYSKKRRVKVKVFTINESFTVEYRNTLPFCDPKKAQIMESIQKMSDEDRKFFRQCVDEAESFIAKECLKGLPEQDSSKHDKEIEIDNEEQPTVDMIEMLTSTPSDKKRKITKVEKDKFSLSKKGELRLQKMAEKNKPLVEFLISDEMKDFLTKLYHRKIQSDLQEYFMKATVRERAKIKHRGFGPLDDEEQIEKVLQTFVDWLQEIKGQKFILVDYIFDVWIPEAIVFALMKLKGYCRKRAWEQFGKGVRRTKEELAIIHQQLIDCDYSREDPLSTKPKDFVLK